MLRSKRSIALLSGLALCVGLMTTSPSRAGGTIIGPNGPCDSIGIVPILNFDVTGSTLTGPLHMHLTVYNTGFATISRYNETVFPTPGTFADAQTAHAGAAAAQQLADELIQGAGLKLCDQQLLVADIPLTTVTVYAGSGPRQKANTFSYWVGGGEYAGVSTAISSFIQTHFPNF